MTNPPKRRAEIDIREEVDIVRVDPLFVERQRNKYASRGLALVVLLNGLRQLFFLSRLLRVPQLRSSRLLMRCWCSELVLLLGSPAPSSRISAAFLDWNDPNFS